VVSVQVSYKKQILFGIMLLSVTLLVIEGFTNIWWYQFNICEFENNELFEKLDEKSKRQLCIENLELQYSETGIVPTKEDSLFSINSDGFRGPEITQKKPENTYRIIVVGGSAIFGVGVFNNETAPAFLQEMFDKEDLDFKVQVINAGIPGAGSEQETKYVKERLLEFNPDLLLVYDGYNDFGSAFSERKSNPILWKDRWIEICNLGKEYNFETIVTLQPFLGTGKKILSEKEILLQKPVSDINTYLAYDNYFKKLDEISLHCTKTTDLREIFDSYTESIYFDPVHVVAKGNKIVAENLYKVSLPIVKEGSVKIDSIEKVGDVSMEKSNDEPLVENSDWFIEKVYPTVKDLIFSYKTPRALEHIMNSFENQLPTQININQNQKNVIDNSLIGINLIQANLTGFDFTGQDLSNAVFYGADLTHANFMNSNLEGADFRFAILNGVNFQQANLRGANFANVDLVNVDLSNVDFSGTNLSGVKLAWSDLTLTKFLEANLTGANLKGAIMTNTNFAGASLINAKLSVANLQGANLINAIIKGASLKATILIDADLTNANLDGADLFDANLDRVIIDNTSLKETKLSCFNHPICN